MIQKFVNWVRSFRAASGPTDLVLFDGDQVRKAEFAKLYRESSSTEYHWIQVSTHFPKNVEKTGIQMHRAPSTGKESTDTKLTVMLVDLCHQYAATLKRVYVVSADGDFVDVLETTGQLFPVVKFAQVINKSRVVNKNVKATARRLNGTNCSILFYRLPPASAQLRKQK